MIWIYSLPILILFGYHSFAFINPEDTKTFLQFAEVTKDLPQKLTELYNNKFQESIPIDPPFPIKCYSSLTYAVTYFYHKKALINLIFHSSRSLNNMGTYIDCKNKLINTMTYLVSLYNELLF